MKKLLFLLTFLPSFAFSSGIYNPGGSTDLLPGDTNYIWNTSTLQSGATFYVSSGTVNGMLTLIPTASQTDNILDVKNTSNKTVGGYFSNGVGIIPSTGTAGTYYDHNLWFKTDGTDPGNSYLYIERNRSSSNWGYGAGIFLKDASATNFDVRGGMRIRSNAGTQYYDTLEFLAPIYAVGPTVVYSCPPTGGNNYYNGSVFQVDPTVLRVPNQDLIPNGSLPLTSGFRIEGLGLGGGTSVLVDEIASIYVTSSPYIINNNGGFSRIGRSYDMLLVSQATWTYNMGLRTYTDQVGDAIRVDHSSSAAALFSVGPEGQLYTSSTFTVAKATVVINGTTNYWPSANASGVLTNNGSGTLSWSAASGGGASSLAVAEDGVQKTSPTVGIDFGYGMNVGVVGSTAIVSLANQATGYVWADATSLQTGATFYVSSGTINTELNLPFTTSGSVLFSTTSGKLYQDNSGLYFNSDSDYLGIGTNAPESGIHIFSTSNQPVLGIIIADNNLTLSNPFILYDIRNGPTPSTTAAMTYRSYDVGTGASTDKAGFIWGSSTSDEDFKMDTTNSRFHILSTSGTASLNVAGNAIIGKNQTAATAPTDGLIVGGPSIFISSMTLSGGVTVQITVPVSGQVLKFDGTYWKPDTDNTGSGGGTLAVATGTITGFTAPGSSPTAVINLAAAHFTAQLTGSATAFVSIDTTTVATGILTISSASATYLTQSSATLTYLQLSSAAATYINKASSTIVYTDSPQVIFGTKTFISSVTFNRDVAISSGMFASGSAGSSGQFLTSGGPGTAPTWTTGGSADNLGNHLATTTLSMQGFSLTNIGTSSSVFGTNGNLTVNSSSTFNSTSTWVGASTTTYGSGTSLDMSSARLTIPYGTAPTATGTGQIAFDTTDGDLIIATGATQRVYATALTPFHVTISSWTDGWSNHTVNVFQAPLDKGITIATITACTSVVASTVTFQLEERGRNTPNTAGTDVFTVAQATANGTCAEYFGSSFTNPTMAAGTHIIFDTDASASSGTTADEVSITVWYWKDVE